MTNGKVENQRRNKLKEAVYGEREDRGCALCVLTRTGCSVKGHGLWASDRLGLVSSPPLKNDETLANYLLPRASKPSNSHQ